MPLAASLPERPPVSWRCEFCSGAGEALYEIHVGEGNGWLFRCSDCGSCQVDRPIDDSVLRDFYEHAYFGSNEPAEKELGRRLAADYLSKLKPHASMLKREGESLEIGAGYGFFARAWAESSTRTVHVIEPNEACRRELASVSSLAVIGGSFMDVEHGRYTTVFAFHVIEHLSRTSPFLEHVARLTEPGAHLALITPNARAARFQAWGTRWLWARPDQHLQFLSLEIPDRFFEERGFEVVVREELTAGSVAFPSSVLLRLEDVKARLDSRIRERSGSKLALRSARRAVRYLRDRFTPMFPSPSLLPFERWIEKVKRSGPPDEALWILRRA